MVPRRRFSRRFAALAAILALLFLYHIFTLHSDLQPRQPTSNSAGRAEPEITGEPAPICPPLPGIEDVLVVMKTGVTEAKDKVPVHFQSTLRCIPHYVIYSDFEEEIEGVKIHDVLRSMDSDVTEQIPDFNIYNRLKKFGRKGLEQDDFADEANSAIGKPNNPGWKLDKWKFLPMVQETLRHQPNAKWYVFMEADTYVSWPTLLAWLSHFDHNKPWYLGTETQIADVIFAHGGSGFMLSNPALQLVTQEYAARRTELHHYTDEHWAGDCVLGKVLADAGVNLHFSWPILQNSNIGELDQFTTELYRHPWCYLAAAFHHLNAHQIEDLWNFEQKRWRDVSWPSSASRAKTKYDPDLDADIFDPEQQNKRILLHSDVFREYIFPEIAAHPIRANWDSLAADEQPQATNVEACREVCDLRKECVQFSFRDDKCFTSSNPRLGSANPNASSGWLTNRIREKMDQSGICKAPEFGAG